MKTPLVSVPIITYNHKEYIRETLDSVLAQKTEFAFEICVGDDGSKDGTDEILKEYEGRYPGKVRVFIRNRLEWDRKLYRHSARRNFHETLVSCNGKYIATLDGDDYWTDPHKLQKQVNFLQQNPNCISCHHWQVISEKDSSGRYIEKKASTKGQGYDNEPISEVSKIFNNELRIKTRTHMFRNILHEIEIPDWFFKAGYGDVSISMILGKYGSFGFIDEEMAAYRKTGEGISSTFTGGKSKEFIKSRYLWIQIWLWGNEYHGSKFSVETERTIRYFIKQATKRTNIFSSHLLIPHFRELLMTKSIPLRGRLNLLKYMIKRAF